MDKATYTKTVKLVYTKSGSEITAHLSRGKFSKFNKDGEYFVDGEFGRTGIGCINSWHGDFESMKYDFHAYIGEKVLKGYTIAKVEIYDESHNSNGN